MPPHRNLNSALGGLLVLGLALLACKSNDTEKPAPLSQPLGAEPAQPTAVQIPAIPRFDVPTSAPSSDVWTPGFATQLNAGDQGKNYLEAAQSCQSQSMQLCTETQYAAACAANPAVASHSSWTATWSGGSNVVARGGGGSCATRAEVAPSERSDSRTALCCERAIGIRTGNKNVAFMKASHADLLSYEKDFNGKSASVLSHHWADSVSIDGATLSKDRVDATQTRWFASHPTQWTLYDVCDLKIGEVKLPGGKDKGLVAKCSTVTSLKNLEVSVFSTHFGRFRAENDTRNRIVEMNHDGRVREMSPL